MTAVPVVWAAGGSLIRAMAALIATEYLLVPIVLLLGVRHIAKDALCGLGKETEPSARIDLTRGRARRSRSGQSLSAVSTSRPAEEEIDPGSPSWSCDGKARRKRQARCQRWVISGAGRIPVLDYAMIGGERPAGRGKLAAAHWRPASRPDSFPTISYALGIPSQLPAAEETAGIIPNPIVIHREPPVSLVEVKAQRYLILWSTDGAVIPETVPQTPIVVGLHESGAIEVVAPRTAVIIRCPVDEQDRVLGPIFYRVILPSHLDSLELSVASASIPLLGKGKDLAAAGVDMRPIESKYRIPAVVSSDILVRMSVGM